MAELRLYAARLHGLSLIELLVALATGVVLSFAAVNLFLHSKISYLQDVEMARLQENGRYALRYLSRELTMAGYLAALSPGESIYTAVNGSGCFDYLMNTVSPLEHFNDVSANGPVQASLPADCRVAGRHLAGTDMLLSRRTVDSPVVYGGERRGVIDADTIYLRRVDHGATRVLQRGGGAVNTRVDLWEYVPELLFLRNYSVARGDGIPTLCRRRLARTSNRMAPTVCLIEGIENLQLEFGIDQDGDLQADRFEHRPAPAELRTAVVARIYLLLRSVRPLAGHLDDRSYTLGNTVIAARNDAYYRRVMQTTVLLRNSRAFSQ